MMAAINAPIPGCAGPGRGVEPGVLAAFTAGVAVTRPASGFTGATSVAAAVGEVLLAGLAGGGGPQVTRPASGFTVTGVVFVVIGVADVLTATAAPELAAGSRDVTRAAKGFTGLCAAGLRRNSRRNRQGYRMRSDLHVPILLSSSIGGTAKSLHPAVSTKFINAIAGPKSTG